MAAPFYAVNAEGEFIAGMLDVSVAELVLGPPGAYYHAYNIEIDDFGNDDGSWIDDPTDIPPPPGPNPYGNAWTGSGMIERGRTAVDSLTALVRKAA